MNARQRKKKERGSAKERRRRIRRWLLPGGLLDMCVIASIRRRIHKKPYGQRRRKGK